MRYIVFFVACVIASIISLPLMLICKIFKKEKEFYYIFLRPFFRFLVWLMNVKVTIHGNLKTDISKTLVISNHTSLFDILLLTSLIKKRLIYVSKIENKKVPVIGWWMIMNKTMFIKRENLKQSLREMLKVTTYLKEGENVMVFPQGTRNVSEIDFKPGSLKFAKKAEADIMYIGIKGPDKIFKGFSYKKKYVDIYAFDPLEYDKYKDQNIVNVQHEIEDKIREKVLNG